MRCNRYEKNDRSSLKQRSSATRTRASKPSTYAKTGRRARKSKCVLKRVHRSMHAPNTKKQSKIFQTILNSFRNVLVHLAKFFGIDLLCYAIMSNHFHLVLRSRPDVVAAWDDTEVARRWLMLCPKRKNDAKQPQVPNEYELGMIRNDPVRSKEIRSRLSDISWWMRLLSQKIGKRANDDDREIGKFWQARYRAVRLLDETAILACAAYVPLFPITSWIGIA